MGVKALTYTDDDSEVVVPVSRDDWQQWVSAGRTRNWMLGDPLIDWLRLYGRNLDYIPKAELDSYVSDLDFLAFIFGKGQEFELGVRRLLEERFEVATVASDYRDIASLDKAEETLAVMQRGVPIIYQGVLWDAENLNYGSPDFLVRSDVLRELFPNEITEAEAKEAAPDLEAGEWHYRVVDTKFTTLHLNAAGTELDNSGSGPAYKAQLFIYNRMLGRLQGYLPPVSYLLGRGWQLRSGGQTQRGTNAFDRLGPVRQNGDVANRVSIAEEVERALDWIRRMRTEGRGWQLLPTPSVPELYPNMSGHDDGEMMVDVGPSEREPGDEWDVSDERWVGVKKWLASELKELTMLWQVGLTKRKDAHDAGVCGWTDEGLTADMVGVRGARTQPILQQMLEVNVGDGPAILPLRVERTRGEWHQPQGVEFYVDFEFCSDLNDDFSALPEKGGQPLIFMIGCGHLEDDQWCFRSWVTDQLSEDEEIRIIREWVEHMQEVRVRLDPEDRQPRIFHWAHAEVTQLENAYNSARRRHGERADWPELDWFDFQMKVMRGEPITVRGALGFGLKAVANAMHSRGFIETNWADSQVDGLGAMVGAWHCDTEAKTKGMAMGELPLMPEIAAYNEVDCRTMMEIIRHLRENL